LLRCALAPAQDAATPSNLSPGAYYALIIGIDNYPMLPHLATAVDDARAVGDLLESSYGFKGHVTYLLDQSATRARIMDALEGDGGYNQTLGASDNLLIYYAGHGFYNSTTDKAYWLPYDAESAHSANHISADDLTTAIRGLASHHVLIISDSCYSGDLTRGVEEVFNSSGGEDAFFRRMLAAPSRNVLSSGGNEPVSDSGPEGHSIFAAALMRALGEQPGPLFTAADLAAPVKRMVRAHSSQVPDYFRIGNSMPRDFPIDVGDFVFVRIGAAAISVASEASVAEGPAVPSTVVAAPTSTPSSNVDTRSPLEVHLAEQNASEKLSIEHPRTVSGTVFDGSGAVIPATIVVALARDPLGESGSRESFRTETDYRGRYRLTCERDLDIDEMVFYNKSFKLGIVSPVSKSTSRIDIILPFGDSRERVQIQPGKPH
jgi:hypothetical protein